MILINEPAEFPAVAIEMLLKFGSVYLSTADYPKEEIQVVFVRLQKKLGRSFHSIHPALKWIITPTTGLNHIDMEYFTDAGVRIISLRGRTEFLDNIHATGEHTLALTLALIRNITGARASVERGEWDRYRFKGRELFGKRVFLIGYGRLGRQVAPLFQAFGCEVKAFDKKYQSVAAPMRLPLKDGLSTADIISLHVSLDKSSEGMLDADLLSLIKPTAYFINTARGELIDQSALLDMLDAGQLAGAALDVLIDEPEPINERIQESLRNSRVNLIVTPHIGGFTMESLQAVEIYATKLFLTEVGVAIGSV